MPRISIITATLDAGEALRHTLRSIVAQQGGACEWIVIDGGSSDGTLALLGREAPPATRWRSEPDAGIYDAWNKACAMARGEWLVFLGAGDELAAPDTLARIGATLAGAYPAHDLVYGRVRYVGPRSRQPLDEAGSPWSELQQQWDSGRPALPPHGAIFHHRSLFAGGRRFDPRYRIAGDVHFLLRHALRKPPLYVPFVTVLATTHGASMNLRRAAELAAEIRRMNRELGIVPPFGHRIANGMLLGAKIVAGRLPAPLGYKVADLYRRLGGRPGRWSAR